MPANMVMGVSAVESPREAASDAATNWQSDGGAWEYSGAVLCV